MKLYLAALGIVFSSVAFAQDYCSVVKFERAPGFSAGIGCSVSPCGSPNTLNCQQLDSRGNVIAQDSFAVDVLYTGHNGPSYTIYGNRNISCLGKNVVVNCRKY